MWFCLAKGHSGDECLSSSIMFTYEYRVGHLFVLSWDRVRQVALGSVVTSPHPQISDYEMCGSVWQMGIVVMSVCLHLLCLHMNVGWEICLF